MSTVARLIFPRFARRPVYDGALEFETALTIFREFCKLPPAAQNRVLRHIAEMLDEQAKYAFDDTGDAGNGLGS